MPSRRQFLSTSSIALTAVATGAARAQGHRAPAPQQGGALPPSIAALTSMRAQMRPITVEERRQRIEKAKRLMTAQQLGAMMLTGGTSLDYFTGMQWGFSERLLTVIIPVRGAPFVVCPAFERDRALEQVHKGPLDQSTDVMTWQEDESPYALIAKGLRSRGLASGKVGVEETVRWVFSDGLAHALPTVSLASATPVTAGCRGVKSPAELALMRLASQVTLKAYEAAYKALKDGMTQDDFARLVSLAHDRLGFRGGAGVQVGQYSALPHGSIAPQTVHEGTILLIDGGCTVGGYQSDLSRTFVLGKPTQKMKDVFEIELRAQTAAVRTARPGIEAQAVDAAARKVITDAGYGPDYKYFTHRVGHGIGMDGHEWPYLVRGNTTKLEPGMTFSDEPGIYIPGEFGVRLEDDMLITEHGAELLTPQSPSLDNPFGPAPKV
jgi:Xaa-Pro dipeptidase